MLRPDTFRESLIIACCASLPLAVVLVFLIVYGVSS